MGPFYPINSNRNHFCITMGVSASFLKCRRCSTGASLFSNGYTRFVNLLAVRSWATCPFQVDPAFAEMGKNGLKLRRREKTLNTWRLLLKSSCHRCSQIISWSSSKNGSKLFQSAAGFLRSKMCCKLRCFLSLPSLVNS